MFISEITESVTKYDHTNLMITLDDASTYVPVSKGLHADKCWQCCARNNVLLCAKLTKEYDCSYHKVIFVPYKVKEDSNNFSDKSSEAHKIKPQEPEQPKHNHYFKDVSKLNKVDVYRIIDLYEITDPCIQHAVKKLLVTGGRGYKDIFTDIQDVIDTLERWKEMKNELPTR